MDHNYCSPNLCLKKKIFFYPFVNKYPQALKYFYTPIFSAGKMVLNSVPFPNSELTLISAP